MTACWRTRRCPHGVAILLVLAVIAGLVALSAPFLLSMVQHNRQARGDLHALQARSGAEAATSHALAQLFKNSLKTDLKSNEPEVTTAEDLKVAMDFPAAGKDFQKLNINVQNPNGTLWSARIEDEQGKINLCSATPVLLGNLLGSAILVESVERGAGALTVDDPKQFKRSGGMVCLIGEREPLAYSAVQGNTIVLTQGTERAHPQGALVFDGRAKRIADYKFRGGGAAFRPFRSIYEIKAALGNTAFEALGPDEFARIERHLTIHSGINGPLWGHAERPGEQGSGSVWGFTVEKGDGFAPGSLVRVVEGSTPSNYARVRYVIPRRDGTFSVELDTQIGLSTKGSDRYIQPELCHPININTASSEVLEACLTGLAIFGGKDAIRRSQAQMLVDFLRAGKNRKVFVDGPSLKQALDEAHAKGILTAAQRDAVYINATEPSSAKLRTATVPFCFHSFGSYTIEGTGVVNAENSLPLAHHTQRQLLTLPTPWPGRFRIEYQAGFQHLLDQGMGSRVVTFPVAMGQNKYRRTGPQVKLPALYAGNVRLDVGQTGAMGLPNEWIEHCETETDPGYRQDGYDMSKRGPFHLPEPPPDQRPQLGPGGLLSRPTSVEMWYKPMGGSQVVFYDESLEEDRNRVTFMYDPGRQALVVQVFDAGMECQDANKGDWTHLRRKPVEYLYPVQLDGKEWYHIAASWKTGRPNGQEIRVDAQPLPPRNEQAVFRPGTRLGASLSLDENGSLELEEANDEDYPASGAVQIGEEIIEYRVRSGNTLTQLIRGSRLSAAAKHDQGEIVMPYGFSVNLAHDLYVGGATLVERVEKPPLTRTRVNILAGPNKPNFITGSEVKKLPVDDATNFPKSGFIAVGGELIFYGKRTATSFEDLIRGQGDGQRQSTPRNIRDNAGVDLASIIITNSADYEDSGIVQIDDDQDEKKVEWFRYSSKQIMNGKHYLVADQWWHQHRLNIDPLQDGNPPMPKAGLSCGVSGFRNYFGIGRGTIGRDSSHEAKAKVIPVVRMGGPHCGNQWSPYGEQGVSEVSIIERGTTHCDLMWVKQAYIHQYANSNNQPCPYTRFVSWGFDFFVGLNDFVTRRYPAGNTRVLKWPSGELPDPVGAKRTIGADRNGEGQMRGILDEIRVNTHQSRGARIAMTIDGTGIAAGDTEIVLEEDNAWPRNSDNTNANLNWPTTGGLVRIEDELIFYKTSSTGQFEYYADVFARLNNEPPEQNKADRRWVNPCTKAHELHPNIKRKQGVRLTNVMRGVLGTEPKDHPPGAQALLLDGMAVTLLTGAFHREADSFRLANGRGFPKEGYAWFGGTSGSGGEVVSYLEYQGAAGPGTRGGAAGAAQGGSFTGCKHFRGRFGTQMADHDVDTIVRCMPFRYWDREAKLYDGEGLAYIQCGYAATNAVWDGVEMVIGGTEDLPTPNAVLPRVLVRFDNNPGWDQEPLNRDGGLFELNRRTGPMRLPNVRADQIELRVYWEFRRGAFLPNSDWKRTFSIEKLRATYHTPLVMRRLDEVEKR